MRIYIPDEIPSMNKGEEAILRGILKGLRDQGLRVDVTVFSYSPEIDKIRYSDISVISGVSFRPPIGGKMKRIFEFVEIWIKHCLFLVTWKVMGKRSLFIFRGDVWKAYSEANLVLVGHDGAFSDANLLLAIFVKWLGKKHAIFGMGFAGFKAFLFKKCARFIMPLFDLIVLREKRALQYFESIGVQTSNMFLKPDPAFFLEPCDESNVEVLLKKEGLNDDGRPLIGMIAVRGSVIFDESFSHIRNKDVKYARHVELFARLAEEVIDYTSRRVVFIPHCIGPTTDRDDRLVARDIKAEVKGKCKERILLIENEYDAMTLKRFIKKLDFLVAERTHGLIGACSVGTPFLGLTVREDERTHHIIGTTFGMEHLLIDINEPSLDEIVCKFKNNWNTRKDIKRRLLERGEWVHNECRDASGLLANLLMKQ